MSRFTNLPDLLYTGILEGFSRMRFDELVPDIKVKHPATAAVFERYAFVYSCDDCPVEQAWHNYGTDSRDMVAEQNQAIARGER